MFDHLFAEEPARDNFERIGRQIGTVIGIILTLGMAWVALRG